jgi:hypothetical protein
LEEPGSSVAVHPGGFGWSRRLLLAVVAVVCVGLFAWSVYLSA